MKVLYHQKLKKPFTTSVKMKCHDIDNEYQCQNNDFSYMNDRK